jgi:hypothetical protein
VTGKTPPGETLNERLARLKDGTWHVSERPVQAHGDVWRKAPGGPPFRTRRLVWHSRIFRHPPGGGPAELDGCRHNHTTVSGAQDCGGREARARNRELKRSDNGNVQEQEN